MGSAHDHAAIARLDQREDPVGGQAGGDQPEQVRPERLGGERRERAVEAPGLLGIVVDGGGDQEAADHHEGDATGGIAGPPDAGHPLPVLGADVRQVQVLGQVGLERSVELIEPVGDEGRPDQAHQPGAQRLAQQPGRPVLGLLGAALAAAHAHGDPQGRVRQADVDQRHAGVDRPGHHALAVRALVLGVQRGPDGLPERIPQQPDRDDDQRGAPERARGDVGEGAPLIGRLATLAQGGLDGQPADDQVDHALRRVAEAAEALDPGAGLGRPLPHPRLDAPPGVGRRSRRRYLHDPCSFGLDCGNRPGAGPTDRKGRGRAIPGVARRVHFACCEHDVIPRPAGRVRGAVRHVQRGDPGERPSQASPCPEPAPIRALRARPVAGHRRGRAAGLAGPHRPAPPRRHRTDAREIQTPEQGYGLDWLMRARSDRLAGITNGVDYDVWNPETDPHIAKNFSADDLSGKRECKLDLLRRFKLPAEPDRPIIAIISRLVGQKGYDLIRQAAGAILDTGAFFIALGAGRARVRGLFAELA